jgi:hypothetical protein
MAFRLPNDAKNWFRFITNDKESGFNIDFDIYYFCLMAGLNEGKKRPLTNSESYEFVQTFPKEYKTNRHLIIALFLKKEMDFLGVSLKEKEAINKELKHLIDPNSPTNLSDKGLRELNQYAFKGFEIFQDQFLSEPKHLESFILEFNSLFTK